ncbi:heavy metal translocating P-type ATPase [Campylobacter sp. VBCF_01 NA2]|uniref:heavy metal translocating P-type ATPase n=1 Tax=Campylobacter sp. VBCF_01 NA2 TaxID=2983836 RepID=UPI0022E999C5|nr:heavy metal translocating P-type ATPase [Campylobacter sp. VBCF_01 NA2]WBR54921.1 heavy metal translocating P-type ATPase metal-binding domain-containing protein [Campylobacter sp. VBCF_01 NA2]
MEKCDHCHGSFESAELFSDEAGHKFCCNGCKNVYYLLQGQNLGEFYERLGKNTLRPAKQNAQIQGPASSIYKNYVTKDKDGFNQISLLIDGIHCSACVWLNEKILNNTTGIIEVSLNAASHKARIVWDEEQISLAEILNLIRSIGYDAYPYDTNTQNAKDTAKRREFYARLLVGIFCVMNIMWISIALYGGYFTGIEQGTKDILHFAEFILATPVLFYTGAVFFKSAFYALKTRTPNMDLLVGLGALVIYIYSLYVMFSRNGEVYFESVAMIITFVFAGKYLQILSQKRAGENLSSLSNMLLGEVCTLGFDGSYANKSPNEVQIGDEILINQGDRVLIDGVVSSGEGSFDYSGISGESIPVSLGKNNEIKSGSLCLSGSLKYRANADFKGSLLSKIVELLENANLKKPKFEILANKISGYFSIFVIAVAFVAFVFWYAKAGFASALLISVSVIIIACPCALALATPIATLCAISVALRHGIIFKEAKMLEILSEADTIVFDKTGTLTSSALIVKKSEISPRCDIGALKGLLQSSNHPISEAVLEFLNSGEFAKFAPANLENITNHPAKGLSAKFGENEIYGGSAKFMCELGANVASGDLSEYFFMQNGQILAKFWLLAPLKDDSKEAIKTLQNLGYELHIISGDHQNAVSAIARELEIAKFGAQILPDEKASYIQNLAKMGKKVVMVGDGINDAAALSLAHAGICLGSGANLSVQKSDVVLIKDDMTSLVRAMRIARKTDTKIRQNIAISLLYNLITIPLAFLGYAIPLFAALSMSLSSLIVVANSMLLRRIKL